MRNWSLRGWLFLVATLFAMLVVGGIALTTYVIVSDGMQVVAYDTTQRLASTAGAVLREAVSEAELLAASRGLTGADRATEAARVLRARFPELLSRTGLNEASYAVYAGGVAPIWFSDPAGVFPAQAGQRALAARTGAPTRTTVSSGDLFSGLVHSAQLSRTVVHVPITLPSGETGVLDVTYSPVNEERVIDAIRLPMTVLAISAMVIMVVLMQTSMAWVLNLVDDLRKAADSVDSGQLDARLPESGRNEIGDLARSINHLIERLQRRSEAQARFVADASHELATPVAGIRGYTNILRAWGRDDPKVLAEAVDAIDRESRRMARLTSDLLNLLHADQGLRLQVERFDLNALARERLAAAASRYMDKEVDFEGPDGSQMMVGDPDRLEDVLSILLDNAGKYTPAGGTVTLTTRRKRERVTIQVSDTGAGIPAEDIPRLFDRFFRSDKARAEGEAGFGLGLAIARSIVENMGGSISVTSEIGTGTTFTVVVPRGRL